MAIPLIRRHRIPLDSAEHRHFERFVEPPPEPRRTFDLVPPDVVFHQELITTVDLELPYRLADGSRKLRMWVIADPTSSARPRFPSPLLRVREGQVVHADVITGGGSHTVHWHGIEPSPMNDGVGKHSFDVKDHYVYQWRASESGFYFYHCHRNTPLHFEMGLFGPLIVDPARGEGWVAAHDPANDNLVRYDREAVWVCTAHDSRWRRLSNGHALMHDTDPNDRGSFTSSGVLHDWRPDVFTISGAPANGTRAITDPRAAVRTRVGETLLLRVLNAAYATARVTVGLPARITAQDGRAMGVPPLGAYSSPRALPANAPLELTAAQRVEMLVRPTVAGTYPVRVDFEDWRGTRILGIARTTITVDA